MSTMNHRARVTLFLPVSLFLLASTWIALTPRAPTTDPHGTWLSVTSFQKLLGRPNDVLRFEMRLRRGGHVRYSVPTMLLALVGEPADKDAGDLIHLPLRFWRTSRDGYDMGVSSQAPVFHPHRFRVQGDRLVLRSWLESDDEGECVRQVFRRTPSAGSAAGRSPPGRPAPTNWSAVVERLGGRDQDEAVLQLLLAPGRTAMPAILEGVVVSESRVKLGCLGYLKMARGLSLDTELRAALLGLEHYYVQGVRGALAEALALLLPRDPDVHALVFRTLEDDESDVRYAAAIAASWLEPSPFERLRELALNHPRSEVRRSALTGCGACVPRVGRGENAFTLAYRRLLRDRCENDPSEEVRSSACSSLKSRYR